MQYLWAIYGKIGEKMESQNIFIILREFAKCNGKTTRMSLTLLDRMLGNLNLDVRYVNVKMSRVPFRKW